MNNKKNLLWLLSLLMIVSVSFVSCNKDDDDNDVDLNTAIIGTWKSVSDILYIDGVKDDDESEISDDDNSNDAIDPRWEALRKLKGNN